MGSFCNYAEAKILDHVFKISAYTPATHLLVALSTADPTDDGSGLAEPSGGSYARVQCDGWTRSGTAPTQVANTADITFPTATGNWGTVTHFAILDDGGNFIAAGALDVSQDVVTGVAVDFDAGDLVITLD